MRKIKFFFQRLIRGWDDSETWSLDITIANFVLPRLIRFKELKQGHPPNITNDEWDEILDKIILSFEYHASHSKFIIKLQDYPEPKEGMILFGQYFIYLWD